MYYVNVYKKHQLQSRARFFILLNYQRRRDSESRLYKPTTSDRLTASILPTLSPTQTAEPIRIFRNFFQKNGRSETVLIVLFWCFLATFRAVLTASKHPNTYIFIIFSSNPPLFTQIFIKICVFCVILCTLSPPPLAKVSTDPRFKGVFL